MIMLIMMLVSRKAHEHKMSSEKNTFQVDACILEELN